MTDETVQEEYSMPKGGKSIILCVFFLTFYTGRSSIGEHNLPK